MYNPLLKTFIKVADVLSFSKAAEDLHLTPPAVIKQINALENHLGLVLFIRSHRGLSLTLSGKQLYVEAHKIINYSNNVIQRIKDLATNNHIIRIAVSNKTSTHILIDLQKILNEYASEFKFKLIPFSITDKTFLNSFFDLGTKFDIIPGIYDEENIITRDCLVLPLFKAHFCCAISQNNTFSHKSKLSLQDLAGQDIMLIKRGWNIYADKLRNDLLLLNPKVNIIDFPAYNIDAFNKCQNNNLIMITVDVWNPIHPLLKTVPLECSYQIPYGLMYSKIALPSVFQFIEIIKEHYK